MVQKRYTEEFRREAVELVLRSSAPMSEISNNLGLKYNTLYHWVKRTMPKEIDTVSGKDRIKELEGELQVVKKQLKRVEQERNILKKAAAYFASQST